MRFQYKYTLPIYQHGTGGNLPELLRFLFIKGDIVSIIVLSSPELPGALEVPRQNAWTIGEGQFVLSTIHLEAIRLAYRWRADFPRLKDTFWNIKIEQFATVCFSSNAKAVGVHGQAPKAAVLLPRMGSHHVLVHPERLNCLVKVLLSERSHVVIVIGVVRVPFLLHLGGEGGVILQGCMGWMKGKMGEDMSLATNEEQIRREELTRSLGEDKEQALDQHGGSVRLRK